MNNSNNKIMRMKTLKKNLGIQYLLNAGYEISENPILLHDMSYKLLAHTENIVTDDPIWNEIVTTGGCSKESIKFFKNEYFIDAVANTNKITLLSSDKLKYDRIFGKIYCKDNITVANAIMVFSNKPFAHEDRLIFEILCEKLSKEMSKIDSFQNYGRNYHDTLIKELIEEKVHDKKLYSGHIANIYAGLKNNLYVAVVDLSHHYKINEQLIYFRDLLQKKKGAFKYFIYSNNIIIILSFDGKNLNSQKSLRDLNKFFTSNNLYAGISSCFENLFELHKYYIEALDVLNFGLKNNKDKTCRIFLHGDVMHK